MTNPTHEDCLNELAEAIDITPEMADRAIERYKSIGEHLKKPGSAIASYSPEIYAQGSFILGTVIRPIGNSDEFDIDLVCELNATHFDFSMEWLKVSIGNELCKYAQAHNMKKTPEDKRHCWTMEYSDQEKFHLDVVPAIPNQAGYKNLLEENGFFDIASNEDIISTAIGITDNKSPGYRLCPARWEPSNPKGYARWFNERQEIIFNRTRQMIVDSHLGYANVASVPQHRVKTPLQRNIQLLKRHRDSTLGDDEHKPTSIIITTLSALAYNGEETLTATLKTVLENMRACIENRGGVLWIKNPSNPSENFAKKWEENPEKARRFEEWLEQAQRDFALPTEELRKCILKQSLAAPAIISKEQLDAEIAHTKFEGGGSRPYLR